ncbi:ABC transporter ATP-binding protein [Roseburia hominis]
MKRVFLSFYKILNVHQKKRMLILFFMMIVGALLETIGISLILPFVSLILDVDSIYTNKIMNSVYSFLGMESSREFLIVISIALIGIYVAKNIYLYLMYSIQYRLASNYKLQMSSKLFSVYLNKPYEFYLNRSSSEIIRNVNTDVSNVFTLLTTILQMLTEITTAIGMIAVLLIMDFQMTVFVVVLLLIAVGILKYIFKPIQRITGVKVRESDAEILKWLNQSVHGIKEVKVTESERYFWEKYYKSGLVSAEATRKFNVVNTIPQLFIEVVFMVGIITYIIYLLMTGKDVSLLVPQISTFAMAAIRLLPIVNRMNRYMGTITYLMPSLEFIEQELEVKFEIIKEEKSDTRPHKLKQGILFDHVSFRYYNSEKWILKDAILNIPVGSSTGIMGPSGSGKTTLIDLLLGLLCPNEGRIVADGADIQTLGEEWLHKIGYVSQSMYLTEDSIKKNIAFGLSENEIDNEKIGTVLKLAQLDEFVKGLPKNVDTKIGEFGTRLSGGQKQRICIARALYFNPEILILDEATSALDYVTENEIMENIKQLKGKITMIIIAHRLKTIKDCEYTYQVKEGKIIPVRYDEIQS